MGDEEIRAADLSRATYANPQVQNFLSPNNAQLITQFFKPSILESLINQTLAAQGAQALGITTIGPEPTVAQSALDYVSQDAAVSDADVQAYYDENISRFTLPPRAVATQATFDDQAAATAFRQSLVTTGLNEQDGLVDDGVTGGVSGGVTGGAAESASESPLQVAATAAGGTVQDLGVVTPGELSAELETALFESTLTPVPNSIRQVSDVLTLTQEVAATGGAETGGATGGDTGGDTGGVTGGAQNRYHIRGALGDADPGARPALSRRCAPRWREAVLQQKRQELRDTWLSGLRDEITVTNLLAEVTARNRGARQRVAR